MFSKTSQFDQQSCCSHEDCRRYYGYLWFCQVLVDWSSKLFRKCRSRKDGGLAQDRRFCARALPTFRRFKSDWRSHSRQSRAVAGSGTVVQYSLLRRCYVVVACCTRLGGFTHSELRVAKEAWALGSVSTLSSELAQAVNILTCYVIWDLSLFAFCYLRLLCLNVYLLFATFV